MLVYLCFLKQQNMKDSLAHLHLICEDWKRELDFFKIEIVYLRKRLEEIASKNTSMDVLKHVEHFENKFSIMAIHVDELYHDVHLKNEALLKEAAEKPMYINVKMIASDENLIDLMSDTSTDFHATKKEFYRFLSNVM
jgi:hypothetical protein